MNEPQVLALRIMQGIAATHAAQIEAAIAENALKQQELEAWRAENPDPTVPPTSPRPELPTPPKYKGAISAFYAGARPLISGMSTIGEAEKGIALAAIHRAERESLEPETAFARAVELARMVLNGSWETAVPGVALPNPTPELRAEVVAILEGYVSSLAEGGTA